MARDRQKPDSIGSVSKASSSLRGLPGGIGDVRQIQTEEGIAWVAPSEGVGQAEPNAGPPAGNPPHGEAPDAGHPTIQTHPEEGHESALPPAEPPPGPGGGTGAPAAAPTEPESSAGGMALAVPLGMPGLSPEAGGIDQPRVGLSAPSVNAPGGDGGPRGGAAKSPDQPTSEQAPGSRMGAANPHLPPQPHDASHPTSMPAQVPTPSAAGTAVPGMVPQPLATPVLAPTQVPPILHGGTPHVVPHAAQVTGTDTANLVEDKDPVGGQLKAGGTLTVADPDTGEAAFRPQTGAPGSGGYGTFTIDEHGAWQYAANNGDPRLQSLKAGGHVTDTLTVATVDGTTHQITVTITGTNDGAAITGADTGAVTEDRQVSQAGALQATGKLDIADVDSGEARFVLQSHAQGSGGFGQFLIAPTGAWVYNANNANPAIQALKAGEHVTDSVEATSLDGTKHTITITITGTNDAPVLTAQSQSVTEDGALLRGQMAATDVDRGDTLTYATTAQVDGFTLNADGSYSFDASHASYQHLAAGQPQALTIPITVTDSAGASSTQNLVLTITGSNDAAVITGTDTGAVTEDTGVSATGRLETSGTLSVVDPDAGEAAFTPVTGATGSGGHGTFTMDAQGHWTYTADNSQQAVQDLGPGERLTDTLTVTSVDGTTHDITVTIAGAIDDPSLAAAVRTTVAAPEHGALDVDSHGTIQSTGFTLHAFGYGEAYETGTGQLVDLSHATASVTSRPNRGGDIGVDAPLPAGVVMPGQNIDSGASSDTERHMLDTQMVSSTDRSQQLGETLVIQLDGTARSTVVSLTGAGGEHGDKLHWTAYAPDGSKVAEGDYEVLPGGKALEVKDLSITAATPFSFIALEAVTPAAETVVSATGGMDPSHTSSYQSTTNVSIAGVRAEILRYETPLDLSATKGDAQDPDERVTFRIDGLQHGSLSAGHQNPDGSWTVTEAEARGLTVTHTGTEQIQVTAIATDAGTGATASSQTVPLTLDPGGARYTIVTGVTVSRTDEDATAPITGDLDIDTNAPQPASFVAGDQQGRYGTFHIGTDGQWTYTVDNSAAQSLRRDAGEEVFTVRTTDGASTELRVYVGAQDDPGTMTDTQGSGVRGPASVVGGHLAVTDVDTPGPFFYKIDEPGVTQIRSGGSPATELQGQYGTFHVSLATGDWTYTVDPAKTATLTPGQVAEESVTVASATRGEGSEATIELRVEVDDQGHAKVLPAQGGAGGQPPVSHDTPDPAGVIDADISIHQGGSTPDTSHPDHGGLDASAAGPAAGWAAAPPPPAAPPPHGQGAMDAPAHADGAAPMQPLEPGGGEHAGASSAPPEMVTSPEPHAADPMAHYLDAVTQPADHAPVGEPAHDALAGAPAAPAAPADDPLAHYLSAVGQHGPETTPHEPVQSAASDYLHGAGVDPAHAVTDHAPVAPDILMGEVHADAGANAAVDSGAGAPLPEAHTPLPPDEPDNRHADALDPASNPQHA